MKIISKLFGNSQNKQNNNLPHSSNHDDNSNTIKLDKKSAQMAVFFSAPKRSLYLGIIGVAAIGLFGARYLFFSDAPENPPAVQAELPKASVNKKEAREQSVIAEAKRLFEENQYDESIRVYEEAVKMKPEDAGALNDLGVLYLKQRKYAESEEQLMKALKANPNCYTCLNNLGYLKTIQDEDEEAKEYLKRAISIREDYLDPYFNLGVLYEKNGDIANSVNAYREYMRRSPDKDSQMHKKLEQHILSLRGN